MIGRLWVNTLMLCSGWFVMEAITHPLTPWWGRGVAVALAAFVVAVDARVVTVAQQRTDRRSAQLRRRLDRAREMAERRPHLQTRWMLGSSWRCGRKPAKR